MWGNSGGWCHPTPRAQSLCIGKGQVIAGPPRPYPGVWRQKGAGTAPQYSIIVGGRDRRGRHQVSRTQSQCVGRGTTEPDSGMQGSIHPTDQPLSLTWPAEPRGIYRYIQSHVCKLTLVYLHGQLESYYSKTLYEKRNMYFHFKY